MTGQADLSTCIQFICIQVTIFYPLGVQLGSLKKKEIKLKIFISLNVHCSKEEEKEEQEKQKEKETR